MPEYPPRPPEAWLEPVLIALAVLAIAALYVLLIRRMRKERFQWSSLILGLSLLLSLATCWLLSRAFAGTGVDVAGTAYGSAVVSLLGFQALVMILLFAMTLTALLWALIRPGDVRGFAVAYNTSAVAYFAAFSAAVVLFTVFATPRLW
ncbi:MAG: hypothetical protein ACT443_12470 [Gemmatimonadota bacterium]